MASTHEPTQRWKGMLLLPERWRDFLQAAGETGMGYSTGDIALKDGTMYRDVIFINPYLGGIRGRPHGDIPFAAEDIAEITVTHRRWKWDESALVAV